MNDAAIRDVMYRYARGVDRKDAQMVLDCYHPDAMDDHAGAFVGLAPDFVAWCMGSLAKYKRTMHLLGQILIEYSDDGNRAQVESYCHASHILADGVEGRNFSSQVRYLDRFERRPQADGSPGPWKIADRVVTRDIAPLTLALL